MNKKGDATMVAAVLLIVSAIVVGVLVSTFSRETEKRVEKRIINMGSAIECEDVRVGLIIDETGIKIKNKGTLGLNKVVLRGYTVEGDTLNLNPVEVKLMPNEVYPSYVYSFPGNAKEIEFIPVITTDNNDEIGCENRIVSWEA